MQKGRQKPLLPPPHGPNLNQTPVVLLKEVPTRTHSSYVGASPHGGLAYIVSCSLAIRSSRVWFFIPPLPLQPQFPPSTVRGSPLPPTNSISKGVWVTAGGEERRPLPSARGNPSRHGNAALDQSQQNHLQLLDFLFSVPWSNIPIINPVAPRHAFFLWVLLWRGFF